MLACCIAARHSRSRRRAYYRQLGRETYARQCHHADCPDALYRKGWNAATSQIAKRLKVALAQYRLDVALAELRASDVDAITFDHAGEAG